MPLSCLTYGFAFGTTTTGIIVMDSPIGAAMVKAGCNTLTTRHQQQRDTTMDEDGNSTWSNCIILGLTVAGIGIIMSYLAGIVAGTP